MTNHKHKFHLLGHGVKKLDCRSHFEIIKDETKVVFVCECGKVKEVKLK